MDFLFKREAPVLHFGPRLPKDPSSNQRMRWSQRRFVLWPALMYRVVAPEVRLRKLNVLQKAVLGMCRAGVNSAERIGARLHVHADLAAVIFLELQERGLLDRNGLPTDTGCDLLEEETLDVGRMVTGHVFQDPWSGDLWPRFIEKLDYVELQHNSSGYPELLLGTTGSPRAEKAFMMLPGNIVLPPVPGPSDILKATRRHRAALRRSESLESADDDDTFNHGGGGRLDHVSRVDDHPTPVFVTSFFFLPESGDLAGDWHACDPFGLGISPVLRRALEREMRSSSGLRAVLESMLGRSLEEQVQQKLRWEAEVKATAANEVDQKLSLNAHDLPQYQDILELESSLIEADLLGTDCPHHKLRDLVANARRVLEATFAAVAQRYPPAQVWKRVYAGHRPVEDADYCKRVYEESAKAVGFNTPLPQSLGKVKPNHIKAACYPDGNWRLRAAIVAAVLAARDNPDHPLRHAAKEEPELLDLLERVATTGGEAVHSGSHRLSLSLAKSVVTDVYQAVGLLSGLGRPIERTRSQ